MFRLPQPSRNLVIQTYVYDPETGIFTHREGHGNRRAGAVAGSISKRGKGKITLEIAGKSYHAHHLAWLIVYDEWPERIDHIDLNQTNNKIANLRISTASQNGANRLGWKKRNLPKGVGVRGNRFYAQIKVNRRSLSLGYFATADEASQAYQKAAILHFGSFARWD